MRAVQQNPAAAGALRRPSAGLPADISADVFDEAAALLGAA
jgi:hypothetical protein